MTFRKISEVIAEARANALPLVLIVTALPLEMKAVRAHLKNSGSCASRAGHIYEYGRFSDPNQDWMVVVAECGAGTHAAQNVVTYAHMEFNAFELTLFVGVAASRKQDIPIGSIVAGDVLYMPYSGKYDADGFSARPHSLTVDPRLVGLARKVERDETWPSRIVAPLKGSLPSDDEYPKPFPPAVRVGPIVSVEAVSANVDSELEAQISRHFGDAQALEMEGYGAVFAAIMERAPILVVRGISDMRSGKVAHLDAIHQPVAAVHAAAFSFEVLSLWGKIYLQEREESVQVAGDERPVGPASEATPPGGGVKTIVTFVLNFEGDPALFTDDVVAELLSSLQRVTNDNSIRLVRTQSGSFRMFVACSSEHLRTLGSKELRDDLMQKHSVRLLGVIEENDFNFAEQLVASLRSASSAMLNWPTLLPDGTWIERPELQEVLARVGGEDPTTTVVLGPPGVGKSALLATVAAKLAHHKAAILAIKADDLNPEIATEEDLRLYLGLEQLPSKVLTEIASYRPVVLLVDQLDALASYLDLKTGRLTVMLNLIRKVAGQNNLHVVMSARSFEYEHDARLRSIQAESIQLQLPAWSVVLSLLEKHGIQAAGWPTDAQELLRSPQSLSIFMELRDRASLPPFQNYQAMLDQMWKEQILERPNGARLSALASSIAIKMAKKETLWFAAARYESESSDIDSLVACNVLSYSEGRNRFSFSHQTLFEHALARGFLQREGRLSSFIVSRMSSLFIRPKIWAALSYLRGVEPATYEMELDAIWTTQDLRLHLRHLIIEFLGQQKSPSHAESQLMEWALGSAHRSVALRSVVGNSDWFERLSISSIRECMLDKQAAGLAAAVLSAAWRYAPSKVTRLIREIWLPDKENDPLVWHVLQDCTAWSDNEVEVATTVLERTDISPVSVEMAISAIGVETPDVAIRLAHTFLKKQLVSANEEARRRNALQRPNGDDINANVRWFLHNSPSEPLKKLLESTHGWDSLEALAKVSPQVVLDTLWPWTLEVLAAARRFEGDGGALPGFPMRYFGDFRFDEEQTQNLEEPPVLGALRVALEELASSNPSSVRLWSEENKNANSMLVQRLIAHIFASEPEQFAADALGFLLENSARYHLGSSQDYSGTSKRLVREVSPFWNEQESVEFQEAVLCYSPEPIQQLDPEARRSFQDYIRKIRLGLLESILEERRVPKAQSVILEESRRYLDSHIGTTVSPVKFIGSPMSARSMKLASSEQIINAFREVPDAAGWDHPKRWMEGGNIQLSREFADFAKEEPQRALNLLKKFEPAFGTRAAGYVVDAVAAIAEPGLVKDVIVWLHQNGFDNEEYRGSVSHAIGRLLDRDVEIDERIRGILVEWLSKGASPYFDGEEKSNDGASTHKAEDSSTDEEREYDRSVLWDHNGISVLPGGNFPHLEVLTRIWIKIDQQDELLVLLTDHLDQPERPDVWRAMLRSFVYLKPTSLVLLSTFLGKLFSRLPDLRGTHEAAYLLGHVHWKIPEFVRATLETWPRSEGAIVRQTYGELVGLIAIVQSGQKWAAEMLSEITLQQDWVPERVGAAYAMVNLWNAPQRRKDCCRVLLELLRHEEEKVWNAAFDLFRVVEEIEPEPSWHDVLSLMSERADKFKNLPSNYVVERLLTILPHYGSTVAKLARGLVTGWKTELGDIRTGTAAVGSDLVDIAITLHRLGPDTREQGLQLFEDMLEINAYGTRETLDQLDSRFRDTKGPPRRRLPRRSPRRRRR